MSKDKSLQIIFSNSIMYSFDFYTALGNVVLCLDYYYNKKVSYSCLFYRKEIKVIFHCYRDLRYTVTGLVWDMGEFKEQAYWGVRRGLS